MRSVRTALFAALTAAALVGAGGCAAGHPGGANPAAGVTATPASPTGATGAPEVAGTTGRDVIDFSGLADLKISASLDDLTNAGVVVRTKASCHGVAYPARPQVSPVFDDHDRLVLIWADPPVHTREGVQVGTSLAAARAAYPGAQALDRPPDSNQLPGLLVTSGDRAYLLLHDGQRVHKLIVGYERYARLLFDTGFGTC